MGLACSRSDPASIRSKNIDSDLKKQSNKLHNRVKLLLLGPGESGKSTVFKQMKILQDRGGFTSEEILNFRPIIYSNCVSQMKALINAANHLEIPIGIKDCAEQLLQLQQQGAVWSPETGKLIAELWSDEGIRQTYELKGRKFQLNDTADYFFNNVQRFMKEDYVPTTDDILRARVRSTGIEEAEFAFEQLTINMVDVGGQRSERRKWIHCFDNVTAILFCASISEYDQFLREDNTQNRLDEAILLFAEISDSRYFENNSIILFLNKTDLFDEKILKTPLTVSCPDYTGTTVEDAKMFLKQRFIERASKQDIYTHFTCALNTTNIRVVITSVKEQLLKGDIEQLGIV